MSETEKTKIDRRGAAGLAVAAMAMLAGTRAARAEATDGRRALKILCMIRYQIDPLKSDAFHRHAENLIKVVPQCGGHLVGYVMPLDGLGQNDVAWGLIAFESLTSYEAYRAQLKLDPDALADAAWTRDQRCILREERTLVSLVGGTFEIPART